MANKDQIEKILNKPQPRDRQADALERIATALEVLAMSAMWRDRGIHAGAPAPSINIAANHFREARDA